MSLLGTASLARNSVAVGRTAASHLHDGTPDTFKLTLAIGGLSDERREELITKLSEHFGTPPMKPIGDGKLRLVGWTGPGYSLQVNASNIIGQFSQVLNTIGFQPSEMVDGMVEVTIEPTDETPPANFKEQRKPSPVLRAIGRTFSKSMQERVVRAAHGTHVAYAENWDRIAMQETGEREFAVVLGFTGPGREQLDALAADIERVFDGPANRDEAGGVSFVALAGRVGTPLGAISLIVRKLASFLSTLPEGTTMYIAGEELTAERRVKSAESKPSGKKFRVDLWDGSTAEI